jgi:RNA polymerase sigma-70 factor, ECF subfamily
MPAPPSALLIESAIAKPMAEISEETRADAALIDRVVARDPAAIAELYDRHNRLLFGLILRIVKERGEAEDVLQEVFLSVWTRAGTYKPALGSPVAWLVGIARNRAIDRLRANGVRLNAVEAAPPDAPAHGPESQVVLAERQRDVTRALDALPAEQRILIESAYYLGLTHSELAARFGLPLGTVKTRVRTGMLALRQQLSEDFISR